MNPKMILAGLRKNAPSILSYTAVGGVALTGWLTDRAAKKSNKDEPFKKHWKNYIPPVIAGTGTIACIIGANCMHLKVEAGLASAVAFYKAISESQDNLLKEAVYVDNPNKNAYPEVEEKVLQKSGHQDIAEIEVYEPYTKQRFVTNQKEILWAELEANKLLSAKGTVKLNDVLALYKNAKKGLRAGNDIGWSWDEDWFNECSSYYWHGGWIDICPQYTDRNGKREFIMEYGIHPMDIRGTTDR